MRLIIKIILAFLLFSSAAFASTNEAAALPDKVELAVPFLCQAPFGNWREPWQDACEEAAIIMAVHYVQNKPLDKKSGNQEILALVKFQEIKYGGHYDLDAKKTAQLMSDFFKYNRFKVCYRFGIEDIKKELAAGNLVLAPMAGRRLGNRYYHRPGPAYHYMVFRGYDEKKREFITNDPGTKRGENFRYKYHLAFNAIHDWNGSKEAIDRGKKAMIVIYRG